MRLEEEEPRENERTAIYREEKQNPKRICNPSINSLNRQDLSSSSQCKGDPVKSSAPIPQTALV
jgi:hypothetical protein